MERGAWQAIVHRVTKHQAQLKRLNTYFSRRNKVQEKIAYLKDMQNTPTKHYCSLSLKDVYPHDKRPSYYNN